LFDHDLASIADHVFNVESCHSCITELKRK
jgi:hypothetical protein